MDTLYNFEGTKECKTENDFERYISAISKGQPEIKLNFVKGGRDDLEKFGVKFLNGVDIAEMYSPKRVVPMAQRAGLRGGMSMDLLTGWDFTQKPDRDLAIRYVREEKPLFIVGSPMCSMFSALQGLNWGRSREQDEKS